MQHKLFSKYLKGLASLILTSLLMVISFNRFMDPYALYDGPRIDGININKPAFYTHIQIAKATTVRRLKPSAIVLGTSRANYGIDPLHPGWHAKPVYNLALPAANIYENYRYLQHAHAIKPLKQVVLMLDFLMFNAASNGDKKKFDEHMLAVDLDGHPSGSNYYVILVMASMDTFRMSIDTFFKRNISGFQAFKNNFRPYFPNGLREPTYKRYEIQKGGGHHSAFMATERNYFSSSYHNFEFATEKRDNWQVYRQLVAMSYQQGIDLYIVISPSHARQFEVIAVKGLWEIFEQWKRQLIRITEQEAAKSGKAPLPTWDFSGFNHYTTEEVPPQGDANTEMKWYWESSHYKKELGDLVLDRIFDHQMSERTVHSDFGVLLTSKNIENHLQQIRTDQQQWRTSFPRDAQEIRQLKME
jgi:hypothetical protein